MIIATWNVNSIRQRLSITVDWIRNKRPDVLLFQEIKCVQEDFPKEAFEDEGYNVVVWGQKAYNGVAILSKYPVEDIVTKLDGLDEVDSIDARYVECLISHPQNVVRVASIYVPNGQEVGSEKYQFKLRFMEALYKRCQTLRDYEEYTVMGGDFNIAPMDVDVYDPIGWKESILCSTPERHRYHSILGLGYFDAILVQRPNDRLYTWWDYRQGNFQKNQGLRIDHLLLSPYAVDRMLDANIDTQPRQLEKTSDHAPVWCQLNMD